MPVVSGTVTAPGGISSDPAARQVKITLVDQAGRSRIGFTSTDHEIVGSTTVTAGVDGSWTATLPANSDISTDWGTSLYRVEEGLNLDLREPYTSYVSVGTGGPYYVGDVRVTLPGAAPSPSVSYLPLTGGSLSGGLTLTSTAAGGSDTTDTTSRIHLTSHQSNGSHFFGELIRLDVINNPDGVGGAKGMIAWRMPRPPGSVDEGTLRSVTWMGAHWNAQDTLGTIHGHWSIETPDGADALRTRLEILISNQAQTAIGSDKTLILTNQADFVVRCDNDQVLRLKTGAGAVKAIEFANADWGDTGKRFQIRQNGTAEGGANAGSDLEIARYSDSGVQQDVPFLITRSNGKITVGGTGGTGAGMLVNRVAAGQAIVIDTYLAAAGATGTTAVQVLAKDGTSRVLNVLQAADVTARMVLFADGKHEWGPGASTARDTNLYRSAADTLTTDDTLTSGANLKLTAAGGGLYVKEGTNATLGVATLVAGTVTVSTTKVSATSRIMLSGQNASGTAGYLTVSARVAATSFTILSSSATDTRDIAWLIVEPS